MKRIFFIICCLVTFNQTIAWGEEASTCQDLLKYMDKVYVIVKNAKGYDQERRLSDLKIDNDGMLRKLSIQTHGKLAVWIHINQELAMMSPLDSRYMATYDRLTNQRKAVIGSCLGEKYEPGY